MVDPHEPQREQLLARLCVEWGYLTQSQMDDATSAQRAAAAAAGVPISLSQILVGKQLLTEDQLKQIENAIEIQTGEARVIGHYEVVDKLGQGGMGAVYKARDTESGLEVALKVLPPSIANAEAITRFQRESAIVKGLDHPNIVSFVEFGFDKKRQCYYCALELVHGEDVATRIVRDGPLAEVQAADIGAQIAHALQHAHEHGLVHRDIKPENIMVTPDGTAKLLDLGLARFAGSDISITQSGMFVGSPCFASPEQVRGERMLDIRSDVYSLGGALYHMVTGRLPFQADTVMATIQKQLKEKLTWPSKLNPDISDGLSSVIARMMAKKPGDRYQLPRDAHKALSMIRDGKKPAVAAKKLADSSVALPAHKGSAGSGPAKGRERRPSSSHLPARRAHTTHAKAQRIRRSSSSAILAVVALLAVAGIGGAILLSGGGGNGKAPPPRTTPSAAQLHTATPARPVAAHAPVPAPAVAPPAPADDALPTLVTGPASETAGATPEKSGDLDDYFAKLRRESSDRMARQRAEPATTATPARALAPGTTTLSFQDGVHPDAEYSGTRDTTLVEATPNTVHGTQATLLLDGSDPGPSGQDLTICIRWDVSDVPDDTEVVGARIVFEVLNTSPSTYSVFPMLTGWDEKTATWENKSANARWSAPGASGASDRAAYVVAGLQPRSRGKNTLEMNQRGLSLVREWVCDPSSNHGLVIHETSPTNGADLRSREAPPASRRPMLVLIVKQQNETATPDAPPE